MVSKRRDKVKVLVTGGEGFIGSHLIDALVEKGYEVYSADIRKNLNSRNKKAIYKNYDITKRDLLRMHLKTVRPVYVFHTAALARIQPSIKNPESYLDTNIYGTFFVLKAAKEAGVKRVIYSASSSAYGRNKIPLNEKMSADTLNPYAMTKYSGELLMKVFATIPELHVETVSLRYFNVYGPRNEYSGPYTTVVTKFLHHYSNGESMPIVGDGKQTRDYTHVLDVVNANILAAESSKVGEGEVLNIGASEEHSVLEIVELIGGKKIKALMAEGKINFEPSRPGEARHTLADNKLARKLLGWEPEINFKKGIKELKKLYGIA